MTTSRKGDGMADQEGKATSARPRRLGRGLSSLVGDPVSVRFSDASDLGGEVTARPESGEAPAKTPRGPAVGDQREWGGLHQVDLDRIDPSPYQPREAFDEGAIGRLADSIRQSGVMQPIVLRRQSNDRFELVAGERRWRAARIAGLAAIPAVVRDLSDEESAEIAVVENVQREDLNPIERARAFSLLSEQFGLTHAQIAERVGLERPTISNVVRLLELEEPLQDLIADGLLTPGHGKALLGMSPGARRVDLGRLASEGTWSVRRLEREVGRGKEAPSAPVHRLDGLGTHLADLERQLGEHLGTRVRVRTDSTGTRGRVEIMFYDHDHFDGLMSRLGFRMS